MVDQVKIDADWLRDRAAGENWGPNSAMMNEIADRLEQNQRRLNWVANELLACDYGDNDHPSRTCGWHVYGWRYRQDRIDRRIYGDTINMAVDLELAKSVPSREDSGG